MSGILVPQDMVVYAARYCLGRLSYAAADGYRMVVSNAYLLDRRILLTLQQDLRQALAEPWPRGFRDLEQGWRDALAAVEGELTKETP